MPYIAKQDRNKFYQGIDNLWPSNPGELNYVFTEIIYNYLERNGEKYQTYNDIVGALTCCQLELYRKKIAPYEDKKIESNGDIRVK